MKLLTDTPMRVGWMPWRFGPGDWRLVVAVKATLELPREGVAKLAEEQAFVTGDMFWEDDPERSLRYAEDLALIKPRGEAWVTGTLRAPEPVTELACAARVGAVQVRFDVIGDRWWRSDGRQTEPVPFTEMPLCWERSFGGPGFAANPVGRGIAPDPHDEAGRIALPNIERHGRLLRSAKERPAPAGAWPIPRTWPERARLVGVEYGAAYLRERWPYFAEDFRWSHFQAAREATRIEGYWRGDEVVELDHLHPSHPRVRCRLPGLRARAFVTEQARASELREVGLVLDTVSIDAGQGTASLVWRGSTPCAGESLEELHHLYVTHEPLDARAGQGAYFAAFVARLRALWEEEQRMEPEAPSERAPAVEAPAPAPVVPSVEAPESFEDVLDGARTRAREQGWPEEIVAELYPDEAPAPPDPPARRRALEASKAAAIELGLGDLADAFGRALERLDAEADGASEAQEQARRVEPPPGLWTSQELRDQVTARLAAGEPLAGLVLAEADLSLLDLGGRDLSDAILLRADLRGATLDGATLDRAVLDGAKLEGASLRGASLVEASLSLVEADGVDFTGARLEGAIVERAMLSGACFDEVQGRGLTLEECFAVGASFARAQLAEAELPRTNFDEATFVAADLTDARLEGASLRSARMDQIHAPGLRASDGADLSEASLRYATLSGASFARSLLIGAKFTESDLTRATFAGARLEGAELLAVEAKGASFAGAQMSAATLAGANLLGARFEQTQLTLADLSGANLYGAELWNAEVTDVRLDGANVEGTKLA